MAKTDQQGTAAGIEALIARLRADGVEEGRAEAARLVDEAERQARKRLDEAHAEADDIRHKAEEDARRLKTGGEQALEVAMRDAVLELKQTLGARFAEQVRGTVTSSLRDEDLLRKMILAVAGRARAETGADTAEAIDIVLPRSVVSLDDLRRRPEELRDGTLSHFTAVAALDMLREGVTFSAADDDAGGIRVVLKDQGLVLDLTDKSVADVILRHLQPRFRAMLEGVVS